MGQNGLVFCADKERIAKHTPHSKQQKTTFIEDHWTVAAGKGSRTKEIKEEEEVQLQPDNSGAQCLKDQMPLSPGACHVVTTSTPKSLSVHLPVVSVICHLGYHEILNVKVDKH